MSVHKCPCVPDCESRTATCKLDGTCPNGFYEYEVQRMAGYIERHNREQKARSANPEMGPGKLRQIRAADRHRKRKLYK